MTMMLRTQCSSLMVQRWLARFPAPDWVATDTLACFPCLRRVRLEGGVPERMATHATTFAAWQNFLTRTTIWSHRQQPISDEELEKDVRSAGALPQLACG